MAFFASECDAKRTARHLPTHQRAWAKFGPVHCALNYNLANIALIEVQGGHIVIDTGASIETASEVRAEFTRQGGEIGDPLAIIYTHSHADHIRGASVFYQPETPIWAHATFSAELAAQHKLTQAYYHRAAKQFGFGLPVESIQSNGIGPRLELGEASAAPILYPTHTFQSAEELQIGGLCVELHAAPGETHDHLFVWMPELRTLHAGDNFYKAFPNLYSIRGSSPRPVEEWIASLDAMRRLKPAPETLILGHTGPIVGADRIHQLLTDYRDAIAYVHDSVIRGLNAGTSLEELQRSVRLPDRLQSHEYLREIYGTVRYAVRGIYAGYMGWFDGEAAHLDEISRSDLAERLIARLGGRNEVATEIQSAMEQNDLAWATWLADHLHAATPKDRKIRNLLAEACCRAAEQDENPLSRSWRLSDAELLKSKHSRRPSPKPTMAAIADMPIESIMAVFPSRVDPVRSRRVMLTLGFHFIDSDKKFTFHIRRGVGELAPGLDDSADLTVRADEQDFKRSLIAGEVKPSSREFHQSLELTPGRGKRIRPIRSLLTLARFARCMLRD